MGGPLSDIDIRSLIYEGQLEIDPFSERVENGGVISYGLSSYGYDVRVARQFKIFTNIGATVVDPKAFDRRNVVDHEGDACVIPPNSFALGVSVERLRIPRDVIAIIVGKSSYARVGIVLNTTPLEPEWHGRVTLEISNTTPLPAVIHANEGIGQVIFFRGASSCERSYSDRDGRYQGQTGITLPFVRS